MATFSKSFATLDKGSGTNGTTTVNVSAGAFTGRKARSTTVTFATTTAGGATTTASKTLTISQTPKAMADPTLYQATLATNTLTRVSTFAAAASTNGVLRFVTNAKSITLGGDCKVTGTTTKTVTYGTGNSSTQYDVEVTDIKWRASGSTGAFTAMTKTYPAENKVVFTPANDPGATAEYEAIVCLKIPANTYANTRINPFHITCQGDTGQTDAGNGFQIRQSAAAPTLTLSKTSVDLPAAGTAQTLTVTANTAWAAS